MKNRNIFNKHSRSLRSHSYILKKYIIFEDKHIAYIYIVKYAECKGLICFWTGITFCIKKNVCIYKEEK